MKFVKLKMLSSYFLLFTGAEVGMLFSERDSMVILSLFLMFLSIVCILYITANTEVVKRVWNFMIGMLEKIGKVDSK